MPLLITKKGLRFLYTAFFILTGGPDKALSCYLSLIFLYIALSLFFSMKERQCPSLRQLTALPLGSLLVIGTTNLMGQALGMPELRDLSLCFYVLKISNNILSLLQKRGVALPNAKD